MEIVAENAERLQRALRDAETREYQDHKASVAEAEARLAAATAWVERTGLKSAVPRIIRDLRPWPAWIKRDDFRRWVPEDLYDIGAEERREEKPGYTKARTTYRVDFRLEPMAPLHSVEFTEEPGMFEGTVFGEARVYAEGEQVFGIGCMMSFDGPSSRDPEWKTWQPNVLVPGPWVEAILALDHRLRASRERSRRSGEAERLNAKARGLPDPAALQEQ